MPRPTIVDNMGKLYSLDARGTFARGGGFGRLTFSYNYFGYHTLHAGIYSGKKTLVGRGVSKMRFYRPTNPQTPRQQAWRAVLASAWPIWHSLSSTEKEKYRLRGAKYHMSGANIFMSDYLKSHLP